MEREIPILYKRKEECCGCSACYAICPKEAISMVEDKEGLNIHRLMRLNVFVATNALRYVQLNQHEHSKDSEMNRFLSEIKKKLSKC